MRIIAHRGLINGPDPQLENHPDTIEEAWANDFDCEIDLWRVNGEWFLGHDEPTYKVPSYFLTLGRSWFHCKNYEALDWLVNHSRGVNFFWHQFDDYTLTSFGYIWAYPGKAVGDNAVLVVPAKDFSNATAKLNCFGVCTDHALMLDKMIKDSA
jgi:hypothetical protein